ncbi:hypothetical protein MHYP_G00056010 [Metynnis hypsauchen]
MRPLPGDQLVSLEGRQWRVLSTRGAIILKRQACFGLFTSMAAEIRSSCFHFDQRVGHVSCTRDYISQRNCCEGDP